MKKKYKPLYDKVSLVNISKEFEGRMIANLNYLINSPSSKIEMLVNLIVKFSADKRRTLKNKYKYADEKRREIVETQESKWNWNGKDWIQTKPSTTVIFTRYKGRKT